MGTKIPSTIADQQMGDAQQTQLLLLEKYAWEMDRGWQGNKTATVARSTEAGGLAYASVSPTYSAVAGLTNLPVFVDEFTKSYVDKLGAQTEEAEKVFIFYDVTGDVSEDDLIRFDGDEYTVKTIWKDAASGRVEVRAGLTRSSY